MQRVVLFVDAQNVYKCARECFTPVSAGPRHVHGQVDPVKLGEMVVNRGPAGEPRVLSEVRIYTGRPESGRNPIGYAAHMRQCTAWERAGAVIIPRALRYGATGPPREKGIDVQLAIDFVAGAVTGAYDVGVICSTDSDLRPALEFVASREGDYPKAESAAWKSNTSNRAIFATTPWGKTWCHYLTNADYGILHDPTDYNIS